MTHSIEEKKNSLIVFKYGRCTHSNNRDIHYFIIKKPIDSMENLQPKWSQCDKWCSGRNNKNIKFKNLSKMHFSGFASPGSSLTEHHFMQSFLSPHVRLVFCFFVCLFASSCPPVSEPVCPSARTPCSRVVSCSNKGISLS